MSQTQSNDKEKKAPRNFKELRAKMSPDRRARNDSETARMLAEMPLHSLREARRMTQENLAQILGVKQASISKLENRTDMYVGTLARFIEAMGGTLEIRASFPDGTAVRITQFSADEAA